MLSTGAWARMRLRHRPRQAFGPLVVDDEVALAEVVASYLEREQFLI